MGSDGGDHLQLPPGFRFYPTDEELVVHFLHRRASLVPCDPDVIPDLNIDQFDPWELQGKALAGKNNQWYCFSQTSQSHSSPSGYWVPGGADELITCGSKLVGAKKSLAFYFGEAPTGTITNWMMHEYHLLDCRSRSIRSSKRKSTRKTVGNTEWVLCRVYDGNSSGGQGSFYEDATELSCLDEAFLSLDDLDEISMPI